MCRFQLPHEWRRLIRRAVSLMPLLLLLVAGKPAWAQNQKDVQVDATVERVRAALDGTKEDGPFAREIRTARQILRVDIDGDAVPDKLVLFLIESGNTSYSYMAAFKGGVNEFVLLDVVRINNGDRVPASLFPAVRNGRIAIPTREYLPEDARCCPSRKSSVTFVLQDGKLVELQK